MRRAAALLVLVLSACGDSGGGPSTVAASEFCAAVVAATCDREVPCATFPDRAMCTATLTDLFDGCPLNVAAVAMGEADYDGAAAVQLLAAIRAETCATPTPDAVTEFPVFTPKLSAGAVCHSNVSCTTGLTCDDVTVTDPQGICTAAAN
jgi:hypothetical protein